MIDDAQIIEGILAESQELKAEIKQLKSQVETTKNPPTDWLSIFIQTTIIFSFGFGIGAFLTNDTAYRKGLNPHSAPSTVTLSLNARRSKLVPSIVSKNTQRFLQISSVE